MLRFWFSGACRLVWILLRFFFFLQLARALGACLNESLTHPQLKAGGAWPKRYDVLSEHDDLRHLCCAEEMLQGRPSSLKLQLTHGLCIATAAEYGLSVCLT